MTISKRHAKLAREHAAKTGVSYMQALREVDNRDTSTPPPVSRFEGLFAPRLTAISHTAPHEVRALWPEACIDVPFDPSLVGQVIIYERPATAGERWSTIDSITFSDGWFHSGRGDLPGESIKDVLSPPTKALQAWGEALSAYLARDGEVLISGIEASVSDWAEEDEWGGGYGPGGDPVGLHPLRVSIPGRTEPAEPKGLTMIEERGRDKLAVDFFIQGVRPSEFSAGRAPAARVLPTGIGEEIAVTTDLNLGWSDEQRRAAVSYMADVSRHLMGVYALERATWARVISAITGLPAVQRSPYMLGTASVS